MHSAVLAEYSTVALLLVAPTWCTIRLSMLLLCMCGSASHLSPEEDHLQQHHADLDYTHPDIDLPRPAVLVSQDVS